MMAQTTVWTGDVDQDWSNASNWSGGVPTSGYTAVVPGTPNGGQFPVYEDIYLIDYTIQNGGSITFNTLIYNLGNIINYQGGQIASNDLFINAGSISFDNDGAFRSYEKLENYGIIDNAASGALEILDGTFNNYGSVANFGNVSNETGTSITNYGAIESVATLTLNGAFDNYGVLNSAVGSTLIINGSGYLKNHADAYFECTCALTNSSTLTNDGSAQINFSANVDNPSTIINNGTLGLSGDLNNTGTLQNNSIIHILDLGVLTNDGTLNNNGSIDLTICGSLVQNSGSTIGGTIYSDGLIYEINGTVNVTGGEFGELFTDIAEKKAPIAGCKPNVFVQLPETGDLTIPTDAIDKGSYGSCGAQLISVTVTPNTFTTADIGQQVVTLDIEDEFGYTSSCDAVITVLAYEPPITAFDDPDIDATCPDDISIAALPGAFSAEASWIEPIATTNCTVGGNGTPDCSLVPNNIGNLIYMGEYNDSKYYCSATNDFTWHEAKAATEALGGHIAIVDDAGENEFIRSNIMADYVWIGLTDEAVEGNFVTVFGDPAPFLNWNSGEPNNSNGQEHYVRLLKSNGNWTDRNEWFLAEYVMEVPCPESGPETCSLEDHGMSDSGVAERLLWMNFDNITDNKEYSVDANGATFKEFPDGTATLTGTAEDIDDSNYKWTFNVTLINKRTWSEWSALGRTYKENSAAPGQDHTAWSYYEVDNSNSTFTGGGANAGKTLQITHAPADYTYGFQIGLGANLKDADFGLSGWYDFSGDETGHGDFNGDLNGCVPTSLSGDVVIEQIQGLPSGSDFPIGTSMIAYRYTDDCGNEEICTFEVVIDPVPSVLEVTCVENIVVDALPGASTSIVSWTEPTVSTNCYINEAFINRVDDGPANGGEFPIGTTFINYAASDSCFNFEGCVFTVTVNEVPAVLELLSCPDDFTSTEAEVTLPLPTATSNCYEGGVTIEQIDGPASGSQFPAGFSEIIYLLTDPCGNTEVCSYFVNVNSCSPTGTSCDDLDACTTGDVYDANCNCAGTFADADQDGVCDAEDICEGSDDNADADGDGIPDGCDDCDASLEGTSCDDLDACTTGDVYDANCNCAGTFADADQDGVCAAEDCDDNDSTLPATPGEDCDDGNPNTINDAITADGCGCEGELIGTGDCSDIIIAESNSVVTTSGYNAPIVFVKVYDASWVQVFDSGMLTNNEPQTITGLGEGTYYVFVKTYDITWAQICDEMETIEISGTPGLPGISINDVTVNEEDGTATLQVCLTNTSSEDVTVNYSTTNATALEGSDYTATSGIATIPAGELCTDVVVDILDDELGEPTETFSVDIGQAVGGIITDAKGIVTILDTDGAPTGGCDAISIVESNGVITTSGYNDPIVFVKVYDLNWGLQFDSGMLTNNEPQTITGLGEGSYFVFVKTYDSSWSPLCDENELITISGAPLTPEISINDIIVDEDAGTATLDICLTIASDEAISVDYATTDGSAFETEDYTSQEGTATIAAGELCTSIDFTIVDDELEEVIELFYVNLSNPTGDATIADDQGTVTILDNDTVDPLPSIFINDVTVDEEAGSALLDICITFASSEDVKVSYATADGSALAGSDYGVVSGIATIDAGSLCTQLVVPIANDEVEEPTEILYVNLSTPSFATIGDDQGSITILDTDQPSTGGCDDILIEEIGGVIYTSGYSDPIVFVKVYDTGWNTVFDSGMLSNNEPQTITGLDDGTYFVFVKTYNATWGQLCNVDLQVTIIDGPGDPCLDFGGDSDGDGVCDDNDICQGFDDAVDSDGDGIPDGCDDATECVVRDASNVISCTGPNEGLPYGGWLKIEGMNSRYDLINGQLVESEEGTATFTGSWVNQTVPECIFDFVIELSGRATEPAVGGPKLHNCLDPIYDDFYYYSDFTGILTGSNEMEGASISIESFGAYFQVGVGANATGADLVMGASGWFSGELLSQPNNGWNLVLNPNSAGHLGDININLSGDYEPCLGVPAPTGNNSPCNIEVNTGDGTISVGGYSEPIAIIQIFNSQWELMYSCMGDCANPLLVDDLPTDNYLVKVNLYDESWTLACTEYAEYHEVVNSQGLESQNSEFLFFNASKDGREVALNWTTNTEYKNSYFVVEHSEDGLDFEPIYETSSTREEGTQAAFYQGADKRPALGTNFYRLKQVYHDGSYRYSNVKTVEFDVDLFDFTVYPNPTAELLNINLDEYAGKAATIELVNSLGQVLSKTKIDALPVTSIGLDVSDFTGGIYGITIKVEGHKRLTRLFVKSKL